MSLLIKNAKLRESKKQLDILVIDGEYAKLEENINYDADEVINAKGNLVTPTFVDPHLHIDKAYTALEGRSSEEGTLEESIKIMHDFKRNYTPEEVRVRAVRAIRDSVKFGVTKIRANVDIDTICGLTALEGCLLAKEDTKEIADVQLVAFPQEGIFRDNGTEELMYEAMEMGADIVGGMPAAEWIAEKAKEHVDLVFKIAQKYDVDIDMHLDQTKDPFAQALEYTAFRSIELGYQGRVTGGHCTSLAYQNNIHANKVIELLKLADFNVCVNPQVLAIMGIDPEPRTRGITRVRDLIEAGVNTATSQDTICDGFHIYGTGDPLDYGLLMAYQAQYNSTTEAKIVYDMITHNAAQLMNLENYGIKEGFPADFNIVNTDIESEAFRKRASRSVYKSGKLIARYSNEGELV